MMRVKYPFAVRHNGVDYAPGEEFYADNAIPGGEIIAEEEAQDDTPERPVRSQRRKSAKQAD